MATENTYILYDAQAGKSQQDGNCNIGSTDDIKQLIIDDEPQQIKSNLAETSFNYINSVIGSGIVGIPYALQQAGLGMGIILLLLIAIATDYSLCIMIKAGTLAGVTTYQALIQSQFGRPGYYFLTIAQFIYPLIAMISYNIIIGDTITKVLMRMFDVTRDSVLGNRHFIVFLCTLFVTLPLSLYRTIVRLSLVSFLSLIFAVSIVLFVVIRAFTMAGKVIPTDDGFVFANTGFTQAVGVIAFAYMCHHNSFLLFDVLDNPTQSRWNLVTHISIGLSCIIIVVFGICGYVTFTGSVQGDLLENFCLSDDWANAARLIFTVTIMLTYPIECFVTREVFENAVFKEKQSSIYRHSILTVSLVTLTFALSTLTDCLSIVLELNGVLAAVPLAYILPAAAYIRVSGKPYFTLEKAPAILLASAGLLIAMIGTGKSIIDIIHGVKCSHSEMSYCIQNNTLHNMTSF
ncbi:putative sodium-coupled neutral amino acid transporter 11 [Caerostris darwini]|uniref:Putative sodium-coupled neutral amino acid transporter 11 n=1 Tax=Caerostris darwini TaxID=1538125 RepID=A0AAV4P8U8_9ARAC|nr:putative sodium-coupled neutral amino acid transporter 11 [Caerostris darwini]